MGTESHQSGSSAGHELVAGHLPLVYNIVGRALNGHPDTDDVVQETMLRAMDGLDGLREPAALRSWLVAIAMNQVRRRYRDRQQAQGTGLDEAGEVADPGSDFVGLTIVRLGLSGQRREAAEATRWLDPEDGELLALWWQEAAGELTRAELAEAMDLTPQHTAVRVQRMKERLVTARVVVRALAASPGCPELAAATTAWDGVPAPLWRKRIARHAKQCPACDAHARGLVPAEGLLAGLALLPVPHHLHAHPVAAGASGASGSSAVSGASGASGAPGARRRPSSGHRRRARPGGGRGRRRAGLLVLGALLTVTSAGLVWQGLGPGRGSTDRAADPVVGRPAMVDAVMAGLPPDVPTQSPSPSASVSASPSVAASPTKAAAPAPASAPASTARSATPDYAQQVLDLVNIQRSQNGCGPLTANAKLRSAAQHQSDDMAARNFFDHTNPDGAGPQQRIEAAGYRWSSWGENIARGQRDPASVMDSWMNSPGHRANILNCSFKEIGVGVHLGTGGPWWTQDFGTPG